MGELDMLVIHFVITQGSLPWQPVLEAKLTTYLHSSIVMLVFRNWMQYSNSDFKKLNGNDFSALCSLSGEIRSSNPRDYDVEIITFLTIRQKFAYHSKCLRIFWIHLYQIHRFGRHM